MLLHLLHLLHFSGMNKSKFIYYIFKDTKKSTNENMICSHCKSTLHGTYYRCLICTQYYLCASCENSSIHSEHSLIKVKPENKNEKIFTYLIESENHNLACFQKGWKKRWQQQITPCKITQQDKKLRTVSCNVFQFGQKLKTKIVNQEKLNPKAYNWNFNEKQTLISQMDQIQQTHTNYEFFECNYGNTKFLFVPFIPTVAPIFMTMQKQEKQQHLSQAEKNQRYLKSPEFFINQNGGSRFGWNQQDDRMKPFWAKFADK